MAPEEAPAVQSSKNLSVFCFLSVATGCSPGRAGSAGSALLQLLSRHNRKVVAIGNHNIDKYISITIQSIFNIKRDMYVQIQIYI